MGLISLASEPPFTRNRFHAAPQLAISDSVSYPEHRPALRETVSPSSLPPADGAFRLRDEYPPLGHRERF